MNAKVEDVKEPVKGYVINCHIEPKDGENPFSTMFGNRAHDYMTAHLDGYAIVPIEKYNRLLSLDE